MQVPWGSLPCRGGDVVGTRAPFGGGAAHSAVLTRCLPLCTQRAGWGWLIGWLRPGRKVVSAFKEFATQMKRQQHPRGDDLLEWQGSRSGCTCRERTENRMVWTGVRVMAPGPTGPRTRVLSKTGECAFPLWKPSARRTAEAQ